jgi:hypothetical protein
VSQQQGVDAQVAARVVVVECLDRVIKVSGQPLRRAFKTVSVKSARLAVGRVRQVKEHEFGLVHKHKIVKRPAMRLSGLTMRNAARHDADFAWHQPELPAGKTENGQTGDLQKKLGHQVKMHSRHDTHLAFQFGHAQPDPPSLQRGDLALEAIPRHRQKLAAGIGALKKPKKNPTHESFLADFRVASKHRAEYILFVNQALELCCGSIVHAGGREAFFEKELFDVSE